jgi:hypothetical protein
MLASTAVAQAPATSGDQPQPDTSRSDPSTSNEDTSNEAGPAETAPTNEQVDVTTDATLQAAPAYTAPVPATAEESPYSSIDRMGIGLAVGGGTSGFTNETLRNTTDVGGDWDVRLTLGTRTPFAAEVSYIGSAQRVEALGLDSDAVLVGNGVQGALRLNAIPGGDVTPFLFAGAAWRHYNVTNTEVNTSDVRDSDDVLEIPVGIGIAGHVRGLLLDLRGEFRPSAFEDLVPASGDDGFVFDTSDPMATMNRWGVNASVGAEF